MPTPYDPRNDPRLTGNKPAAPTTTDPVAAIDARVRAGKKKSRSEIDKKLKDVNVGTGSALAAANDTVDVSPLNILSLVPATAATIATLPASDYLVGEVGGDYKKLSEVSIFDRLLGNEQLSLADPLKALLTDNAEQKLHLKGGADEPTYVNAGMKIYEGVGLLGDIVFDPLNLIGAKGINDDAFKLLDDGARLDTSLAKLTERAAVEGPDSWAAKGAKLIEDHHAMLDSIDADLAAGAIDDATAVANRASAGQALRDTYGEINGHALLAGDNTLASARFPRGKVIHEGGIGGKSRAAITTERATELQQDIARALGSTNPMETGSTLRLPIFGGRTANEMVKDVWARGFGALPEEAQAAMGFTPRIHRFTVEDFKSGNMFNPFSDKGAGTFKRSSEIRTPMAFIRENSIKGGTNLTEKGAGLIRPGVGRSGKIWRSAFELTDGGEEAVNAALTRLKDVHGIDAVLKHQDEFINYPLTVMNEARLDGLIRSGGKRLAKAAAQSQQEIGRRLMQETEQDAAVWTLYGTDDVVTSIWPRTKQAAMDSVDSAKSGAKGEVKTSLAGALRDAMGRLKTPLDLDEVLPGESISAITGKVFSDVINDPEFADDISEIFLKHEPRMTAKGVTKGDLLRYTMNALSTAVTISKETAGVFDWVEAMTKVGAAKELFSTAGAEVLGREAKLLSYMEDMGLAVLYRAQEGGLTETEIKGIINQKADEMGGLMVRYTDTFERVLAAKEELKRGLKLRGVTDEKIAKIENDIANNVMDREAMTATLADAEEAARLVRGDLDLTADELRLQQSALRDVERSLQKLDETHLALLGYRDLQDQLQQHVDDLESAALAVDMAAVNTGPLVERLSQLLSTDFLDETFPVEGSPWTGVSNAASPRPAMLLNQGLADSVKGTNAGIAQQQFNRSLRLARTLFGDSIDLAKLGEHGAFAKMFVGEAGMTEGALNTKTIARFFEKNADPRITEIADGFGGWETLLRTQDESQIEAVKLASGNLAQRRENQIARDLARQAAGEDMVIAPKLTRYGVTGQAINEFMLQTMSDRIGAITPLVNDLLDAINAGDYDRIGAMLAGNESGVEIARQMLNGDYSHLNALVENLSQNLDMAIGIGGGFGDAGTFGLLRELIMADPAKHAVFTRALDVFSGIQNASALVHAAQEATEAHVFLTDEINSILGILPNGPLLEARKADLIDVALGADPAAMANDIALTTEQRDQIREVLKEATKRVNSTRSKLTTLTNQSEKWRVALDDKLTDLNAIDGWIQNYETLVDDQMATAAKFEDKLRTESAILKRTPVIGQILGASADIKVVRNGFIDFAQDPKVSFKTLADGSVVRRSDDEIIALWKRRIDGAAKWTEILRDRAINGYWTKGAEPKFIEGITSYSYAKALEKEWMMARAEEGFAGQWRHAALADTGGANAMIAMATGYPSLKMSEGAAIWDMLTTMLKSGYVGTPAFSVRNLTGALMENVRQGVNLATSKKVWGADSVARALEGMASFVNTIEDEALAKQYRKAIAEAEKAVEKHFGSDIYGATAEARHVGVTDSVFQFQDISGVAPGQEGQNTFGQMARSWKQAIKDTRMVARLETEGRFGDKPLLRSLAGVTGGVSAFSTHPARYFEQRLAGSVETLSRRGIWAKAISDPDLVKQIRDLEELAIPFTARPGVEALVRVDLYAQRRLAGDSTEMAFTRMMASHFDYTDLSEADERLKRMMPFWIWRSRSMAHYAEMLSAKPSTFGHTFQLWEAEHRSKDPNAPRYTTEVGGAFDAGFGLGLAVPDPASDIIGLVDQMKQGYTEDGAVGAFWEPTRRLLTNDANAMIGLATVLGSGVTGEGIPIDTPASIQGPLNTIASAPGGTGLVEKFAVMRKGKWYWRYPGASYAFGELLPVTAQVVKITQPAYDSASSNDPAVEKVMEATFGALTRFFGSPVRVVPEAEQDRAAKAESIRRKMAARNK